MLEEIDNFAESREPESVDLDILFEGVAKTGILVGGIRAFTTKGGIGEVGVLVSSLASGQHSIVIKRL